MSKPLTMNQIIKKISDQTDLPTKSVKTVLNCLNDVACKEVKSSGTCRVCNLGKLKLISRKARMMRNPQTGKQIKVPAKKVVKFRVSKALKEAVL